MNLCKEGGRKQNVLLCWQPSWEESRRHTQWWEDKVKIFNGFMDEAEEWLSEIIPQLTSLVAGSAKQQGARMEDEITSRESISKVSTWRSRHKSGSTASSVSRASARLGVQADLAALSIETDALRMKHKIERQEEEMRQQNDQRKGEIRQEEEEIRREEQEMRRLDDQRKEEKTQRRRDETMRRTEEMRRQKELELDTKMAVAKSKKEILERKGSRCSSRSLKTMSSGPRENLLQLS